MSKWLRRGFGGGSNTPTSVGGGGGPTAVYTPTAGGGGGMATGRQDSTYPLSHMEGAAAGGGGPNGATTGTTAPMPQAAYYYDPPPPTSHQQHNAAAAAATTKSRSNRTPGSTTAMTNTPQGPPPVGGGGEESSIHVHPPKVSRHVRTPSDPSRITAWGMMTTTTPAGRGGMISTRDAAPPPPYTTTNNNNDIAQPPPPGTTPTSIHANNNNTNNNNQNYNNHTSNYNNTTTTSTAYPQPNNANNNDSSIVDYSSSQLSNPQGGSMPRRPAYLLHRDLVIGKGSYGQVCIASRGEAEGGRSGKRKKFACKCVMLRSDPKYIAKLQEEVNVLRELRGHENVIRLYDVFCVENELFIITELGRGGDLFHLLTTHPKHGVTESYAAKTVAQMLSAVAFLHSRQICHRDLKLENWVLESGKDVWSPLKLIDFGLSTHFTPGHRLSRVVGSSYYVAPEVLKKSYTEACDLWSLGVIVYMLLSGAPPFYGRTDEAIKASIINGEYTFPHELFRDVSDDAMAFVATLLSYNVEYRYTSEQALSHTWLSTNCDPEILYRAKEGAKGRHPGMLERERMMAEGDSQPYAEPMQM